MGTPRPASSPYLIVTRRERPSVRIVRLDDDSARELDVHATTLGATSDATTAALTAPDANELVLVSGWPPRARIVGSLGRPHDAAFTSNGLVAVTEESRNALAFVDPRTATLERRVELPSRPHNVVRGSGSDLIVTLPNARSFAHVDARSGTVRTVNVGERPHACVPVREEIVCVTYDAPHLLFVHGERVTSRRSIGVYPHHLRVEPSGDVLVSDPQAGRVFRIDPAGRTLASFSVLRAEQVLERDSVLYVASDRGFVKVFRNNRPEATWDVGSVPHAFAVVAGR